MEESVQKINETKLKPNIRPKTSKKSISIKEEKHIHILNNQSSNILKTEKNKKQDDPLFSKFDFNGDYILKEAKNYKKKLKTLNNINLMEDKIDNLYNWENLFNNFKPLHSYFSLKKTNNKKKSITGDENKEYESPILLVDLPESQMNLFFGKKNSNNCGSFSPDNDTTKNLKKTNFNIRPVSMYAPREENSCFYYSNTFSDYYKEDFKTFSEKMPILKAKLKIKSSRLRKETHKINFDLIQKYKLLEEKKRDKNIIFDKLNLIIAGKRKNPLPLVKEVFLKKYYSQNILNKNKKSKEDDIEIKDMNNNFRNKFGSQLVLSYYDINDPSIALFNKRINQNIENNIYNTAHKNQNKNNINIYKSYEKSLKKDQIIKEDNESDKISKKSKKQKSKIKFKRFFKKKNFKKNINIKTPTNSINFKTQTFSTKNNTINKTTNITKDNLFQEEYIPKNSFPLKTSSDVGNISYNKIKKFIQEKYFLNKFKGDNISITQPLITIKTDVTSTDKSDIELIWDSKKIKPKKTSSFYDAILEKKKEQNICYKWDQNGNLINLWKNKKCNEIYFNKCITNKFNNDLITLKSINDNYCFYPINAFNKGEIEFYINKNRKNKKEDKNENKKDNENNKDNIIILNSN